MGHAIAAAGFFALFALAAAIAMYWLPTIVAIARKHSQLTPIVLLNFLLGWTLIGWVVALVWAFTTPQQVIVVQQPPQV